MKLKFGVVLSSVSQDFAVEKIPKIIFHFLTNLCM